MNKNRLNIRLSILDQSPVMGRAKTSSEALMETIETAKMADKLGYTRYWLSEHHNAKTLAGTAPEILITHLANHTQRIRIGAGGIMLPNHSALKVAESFRLLEALFPNRIDLGIGRAPGTDRLTAALLNPSNTFSEHDFLDQLKSLDKFLNEANDKGTIYEKVKAYPSIETMPQRWMLTSSGDSAIFAAKMGLPMSYAHFIRPHIGRQVIDTYKAYYQPNREFPKPMNNIAVFAFCSEQQQIIEEQQAMMEYRFIAMERGALGDTPFSYQDIKNEVYSSFEKQRIAVNRDRIIYDTPINMKKRLDALAESTGADEIMLITYADKLEDRLKSFELVAEMYGLNE